MKYSTQGAVIGFLGLGDKWGHFDLEQVQVKVVSRVLVDTLSIHVLIPVLSTCTVLSQS